jgi:hypothetical protein
MTFGLQVPPLRGECKREGFQAYRTLHGILAHGNCGRINAGASPEFSVFPASETSVDFREEVVEA